MSHSRRFEAAKAALQGILAADPAYCTDGTRAPGYDDPEAHPFAWYCQEGEIHSNPSQVAARAVWFADALLAELEKPVRRQP